MSAPRLFAILLLAASALAEERVKDVNLTTAQTVPTGPSLAPLSGAQISLAVPPGAGQIVDPPQLQATDIPLANAASAPANSPQKTAQEDLPKASAETPGERISDEGRKQFDLAGFTHAGMTFVSAPVDYRFRLAMRGAPKVEITKVLSLEGSAGAVFEARLGDRTIAVKTYGADPGEKWDRTLKYFDTEVKMADALSRVLGPEGMAPRSYGEVDIGKGGNPSIGFELINGKNPDLMTARETLRLITPDAIRQAAKGIRLLAEAGLGGGDSPQPMILDRAQTVNGVRRKAGDLVFVDPGGLRADPKKWKSPADEARWLAFCRLRALDIVGRQPDARPEDIAWTQEQIDGLRARAAKLVRDLGISPAPAGEK